jgi:alpha-galactosidase
MKQGKRKIVLLGVGSTYFTRGIVESLCVRGGEWEVGLVDIDPKCLSIARRLAKRIVDLYHAPITLSGSTDRRDVLAGADAVVATIGVGGRKAWAIDIKLPRRFGIFQHTGDTYGAGGISRSLRTLPVLVAVAKDMEKLCPGATLFDFTNPMTTVCRALNRYSSIRTVGLCCGVRAFHRRLSDIAGVRDTEVFCKAVGLNHFTWILDLVHRGKSIMPLVRERMEKTRKYGEEQLTWDLFTTFDAFPCVGDGHISEFIPGLLGKGKHYGKTGGDVRWIDAYLKHWDRVFEEMKAQADGRLPVTRRADSPARDDFRDEDMFVEVLSSSLGEAEMFRTVNLPNNGIVTNVQPGAILECTTWISGAGFHPIAFGDLPPGIAAIVQRTWGAQELAVEASMSGDRKMVLQALMASMTVDTRRDAERLADALLKAHRKHLPHFFR